MSPEHLPLSPQQRRLWSFPEAGERRFFRATARVAIGGPLDSELLARALHAVAAKYEILRSAFVTDAGAPAQVVSQGTPVALEEQALDELGAEQQEARIGALLRDARRAALELESGSPLTVTLVRRSAEQHELLITTPALCADRTSLENLVVELARAYQCLAEGRVFSDEAMQYADIAAWQNELLESEDSQPGLQYWRQRDLGPGAQLAIPFEAASPGPFALESLDVALPPALGESIARAAGEQGVSTRVFMLAAWITLLRRLGGQADVLVGVGLDGRAYEELEEPLGLLARSLPLPLCVEPETTFRELLQQVSRELEEMEGWQECFSWEHLDDGQNGRPTSLPFSFEYDRAPEEISVAGLSFRALRRHVCAERTRCRLVCEEGTAGLALTLDYDAGVLGEQTVRRLGAQYVALLASAAAEPGEELGRLDVLSAAERQALLVDFNATDAEYPRDLCAHHWIEEQARKSPDAIAVRQGRRSLTYAELDTWANQLAWHLQQRGVTPDTMVALCIERSLEMVVAIVGILKAGGAYVPVDPAYPRDRIQFLLEDTSAPVLVTQASLLEQLPRTSAELVCLDADAAAIAEHPTDAPPTNVEPANLVYVIYTSGSTGKPKGVVITHEKLVISNTARVNWFGHTPETFLLLSSVAFDSSVVGIFWSLCGGGTLELIPQGQEKDVAQIPRVIAEHAVSHLLTLPSFYRLILEQAEPEQLASLDTVIVAGEACPLKMVDHHRTLLPGVGLFSEYGATETTVFSSVYDCLTQTLPIAPVGSPIDNAQMYVLDERLQPCPTGVPGEVHFGGIALALGYWRRPELTAERFISHPFSPPSRQAGAGQTGERLYKSGDLARHLEDGNLEFLGRLDNQVKVRGFRIELEEIEVALLKHPRVKETAVLARAELGEERRLVGYVLPEGATAPTVSALREFLLESLPDYMVPSVFLVLDEFPRTPNGKLDRKALPEPGEERPELDSEFAAPSTPAERVLAEVWCEVLGLERVGVNDNFFELGGDSILSIQVVSRAKRAGLKLSARQLFENQTVASLAAVSAPAEGVSAAVAADQAPVVGPVPLTPVQHWFFELELPDPDHWNMPLLLEATRPLAAETLESALRELLVHHDALRLRFHRTDAGWSQENAAVDAADSVVLVATEDLSSVPEADQKAALEERAAAHHTALDLEHGPLMRAVLFERGAGRPQRLIWIVHHLAIDGVSWRILLEDLGTALDQLERGEPIRLPAKTTSFQRWARELETYAAAPERLAELEHWTALSGSLGSLGKSVARLPLDHGTDPRGGRNRESSARKVTVTLDEEQTRALLTEVPKTYNTQINDALLTALVHAFAGWTGESALLVNLEGHGREDVIEGIDLSRTVGWFTTDYPALLSDTMPFEPGAALRSIKEQLRQIPDQGFGFGVGRYLCPDATVAAKLRDLPRPALGFNYLGQFDQVFREDARFLLRSETSGPALNPDGQRVFAIEVYGLVSRGRLELDFEYSAELHERATIEALAAEFESTLVALIEHCLSPDAGGFTASDFSDFNWDASDLGAITGAIEQSQDDGSTAAGDGR